MIIPDPDIQISDKGSWYHNGTIHIGLSKNNKLTDEEIIPFLSDSITHEYIHHILEYVFSGTVSCLFDAVGDHIRNIKLAKKVTDYCDGLRLWSDRVAEDGIDAIIDHYELDKRYVKSILKKGC